MRTLNMADRPRYYVSLGDSMSIDDYTGRAGGGAASLLYRNRDDDFPEWIGRDLRTRRAGCRFVPMAMDGATSAAVRYVQLPRLAEMDIRPEVVTITMGGNDLLQCFGNDDAAERALADLRENGQAVVEQAVRLSAPGAAILLGTIYDPSDGTGDAVAAGIGVWPNALSWLARYNDVLRSLAEEHGVVLADIHGAFLGHGVASGDSPASLDPAPANRALYYCGAVEPNAWGASAIRALWWHAVEAAGIV